MIYGPYKCRGIRSKSAKMPKKAWEYHYTARRKKCRDHLWVTMILCFLALCLVILLCGKVLL